MAHEEPLSGEMSQLLAALERFVVENADLLELEHRIGRFNIFDALGVARVEIRHSNFLAFILDPAESHGQGQLFLKAILMDVLTDVPPKLRPISPMDLDGTDMRGVEVRREWKHIDLLILCKQPQFAIVFENKVDSGEHSDQLSRYQRVMAEQFPGVAVLFVLLTPDGDDPSEDTWVSYSYADIHRVFLRVRDTYQNAIGGEVRVFLDHYLSLLGSRFMNDEQLDELCRRIYKNHRQALDLIWERVGSPQSGALAEVVEALEEDPRWHVLYKSSGYVDFVPKSWLDWLPKFVPGEPYPFCAHIRARESSLSSTAFVGPMKDSVTRKLIVATLREKCPSFGFKRSKASQVEGKWNRASAAETFLDWGDVGEPLPELIRQQAKVKLEELFTKLEKLATVLKPLCVPLTTSV